jgi:cell division protease FtsH
MLSGEKYQNLGARMRRGILLHGPSGTGKTTLAKACAHESNVSFFSSNAAEFCEIYVGMGPKKIRDLFSKAKQSAPSIIYIDEIDAIGKRNNGGLFESSNSEKNSTINQLLSEMDGFDSSSQVLVIGSTNRLEMVDSALLRPGRFDLKIYTPLPNLKERIDIMKHHLKNKKY